VEYPNISKQPIRYDKMWAPGLFQEVDCRISLGTLKRTNFKGELLTSTSLKNLYSLFRQAKYKTRSSNSRGLLHRLSVPATLQDVYFLISYFLISYLFDGAVIDADQRLVSSNWQPERG
jgi:hypothetical protein